MGMCSDLDRFALAEEEATFGDHMRNYQPFLGWREILIQRAKKCAILKNAAASTS
jgi:hypothetical protein